MIFVSLWGREAVAIISLSLNHSDQRSKLSSPSPIRAALFTLLSVPPKPRNEPLEKAIGERLRTFRDLIGLSQLKLAALADVSVGAIKAYEGGRAALPWKVFAAISRAHGLNPYWLALGQGHPRAPFESERLDHIAPHVRFSQAFEAYFRWKIVLPKPARINAAKLGKLVRTLTGELHKLPTVAQKQRAALLENTTLADALAEVNRASAAWLGEAGKLPPQLRRAANVHPVKRGSTAGRLGQMGHLSHLAGGEDSQEKGWTTSAKPEYVPGMSKAQAELQQLLSRARKATAKAGKRTELARYLEVKLQRVSEWLSLDKDAPKPGGEYTLQIQRWVALEEQK